LKPRSRSTGIVQQRQKIKLYKKSSTGKAKTHNPNKDFFRLEEEDRLPTKRLTNEEETSYKTPKSGQPNGTELTLM